MNRAVEIVRSGELGKLTRAEATFGVPIPYREGELRWTREQGGGALMDLGTYPVMALRTVLGGEPKVIRAKCTMDHDVDVTTIADLDFAGVPAALSTSMTPERFGANLTVEGMNGKLEIMNYVAPQMGCRFTVTIGVPDARGADGMRDATYVAQAPMNWVTFFCAGRNSSSRRSDFAGQHDGDRWRSMPRAASTVEISSAVIRTGTR